MPSTRLALAFLPFLFGALASCGQHDLQTLPSDTRSTTTIYVYQKMERYIDVLLVLDTTPSMRPKQAKLAEFFNHFIESTRSTATGGIPNLRVGIITSDLGSGIDGVCAKRVLPDGSQTTLGDRARFQMPNAEGCGVAPGSRWLEIEQGVPQNFQGDLATVFSCIAGGIGTSSCEISQPLQAIDYAFSLPGNEDQRSFLRPEAAKRIILMTNQDDCSIPPDSRLFSQALPGEAPTLRCATQGHQCNGQAPDYGNGFSSALANCQARMDPTCASPDQTGCNPLAEVKRLATAVKALSKYEDSIQILAMTGWPRTGDPDPMYRIDRVPTAAQETTSPSWTLGPICEDPGHPQGTDPVANGLTATPSLRIAAFLDQFLWENAALASICNSTLSRWSEFFGEFNDGGLRSLCLPRRLYDTNLGVDGIQGDCTMTEESAIKIPSGPGLSTTTWQTSSTIPACETNPTAIPCWRIERHEAECPVRSTVPSQKIIIQRDSHSYPQPRTRINLTCMTCPEMLDGIPPSSAACRGT